METVVFKNKSQEAKRHIYRNVWTSELSDPIWSRLLRDLDRLDQMPKVSGGVSRRQSGKFFSNKCLHEDVSHSRDTAALLEKLMDAFVASTHFSTLCQRFDFLRERGHHGLRFSVLYRLMAFWASREFPWLHRKLFGAEVKRNLGLLRSVSVGEFFQYAPPFVLYRLKDVFATAKTANWALWVISGKNLRRVPDLPFPLTRMMAHFTINAPPYLTFSEALFFGRIRGLGGSVALHDRLRTCLRRFHRMHEFHEEKLLSFLVKHQADLDLDELPLLLGYVWHRFFDWRVRGQAELEDCSFARIRREMQVWHRETQANPSYRYGYQDLTWPSTGYQGFTVKVDSIQYRILELTSYRELSEEGKVLSHCVASYVEDCKFRRCSIWSLRARKGEGQEKSLVTIELRADGYIAQALGKLNTQPNPKEMVLIKDWAAQEGLRFRPT